MDMDSDSALVSRLEVVNTGRRRRWTVEEKIRIVEESLRGSRQASATARRHDISNSLLFRWRKAWREGRLCPASLDGGFARALIVAEDDGGAAPSGGGRMEIVAHGGRRVIVGADVDAAALARVLGVLEGRPVRRSMGCEGG
jgi:transposase